MDGEWPKFTTIPGNPEGIAGVSLVMPSPSRIGQGLSTRIDVDVPVTGTATQTMSGEGQTITGLPDMLISDCTYRDNTHGRCKLSLQLDAAPGKAPDAGAQKMADDMKSALNAAPGVEGMVMVSGLMFNLETERFPDGNFVARSDTQGNVPAKDAVFSRDIHVVIWSSAPGDTHRPPGVPG